MDRVLWPFGEASEEAPDFTTVVTLDVWNNKTIFHPATLTGNMTLNINPDAELRKGAELLVKVTTTATETLTFGTGILAPVITGVAGKTQVQSFVFDGSNFVATGAVVQLD